MLAETLRWTEGRFDFVEAPLPEEALAVNLRLPTQQVVLENFTQSVATVKAAPSVDTGVGTIYQTTSTPPSPGQPSPLAESLRLAIFDCLLKGQFKLPLLPTVASKVMEITRREDFSLRDLSDVILTDQVIAAQVLKHANSAAYGSERTIDSMPMAVQRLGSENVTNIVFALSLQSMRSGRDLFLETKKRLWEHASACALLARFIALPVRLDHNLAFLCALMMDFGKIVLLSIVQEVITKDRTYQKAPPEIIDEIIEAYHPKVGSEVGKKWQLPLPVLETMTYHHNLAAAGEYRAYAAACNFSDVLITTFAQAPAQQSEALSAPVPQLEDASAPALPTADELAQLPAPAQLGLAAPQIQSILERVPECLKSAQSFLIK
jgi:HD-like signal output (HDOD) protein